MLCVRRFDSATDYASLRNCAVELQDFERTIDCRLPCGDDIADDYIAEMLARCDECSGSVLVAEDDGQVVGYVTVLCNCMSGEIEDGNLRFAVVSDLFVGKHCRGHGAGRMLLAAAEDEARLSGAATIRICTLAENRRARELYLDSGYAELYVDLEKPLRDSVETD